MSTGWATVAGGLQVGLRRRTTGQREGRRAMTLERTRLRERDRDLEASHPYEVLFSAFKERRKSSDTGQIVFKGKDLPWQQSRQGRSKYYLHIRGEANQAIPGEFYSFIAGNGCKGGKEANVAFGQEVRLTDRKSTRLNSSH